MQKKQRPFARSERLASLFHQEIAAWLVRYGQAPDQADITITRVEVTKDLSHAKIGVLSFQKSSPEALLQYLNQAKGKIRQALSQALHLRKIAQLHFYYDYPYEEATKVEAILAKMASQR